MLEWLVAASLGVHAAPECPVRLESRVEDGRRMLRARPACPLGFDSSRDAMRALLAHAGGDAEVRVMLGRLVDYPWLSALLERSRAGTANAQVAQALRALPELGHLFPGWRLSAVSVEKVLVRNGGPHDAIVWLTLERGKA